MGIPTTYCLEPTTLNLGESGHGLDGRIVRATQISQKCIKMGTPASMCIFSLDSQPAFQHVSSHNVFGLITDKLIFLSFNFFVFWNMWCYFSVCESSRRQFQNLPIRFTTCSGRFRMIQSCEDTDIRYEICLLINYLFTVPRERLGSFRGSSGWGWFGRVIPMSVLWTSLNNNFLLKIRDDMVQLVAAFICIQRWIIF